MGTRRVVVALVAAVGLTALAGACGPPPEPGPTTTTTVPDPGGLPVVPRMLLEPVGAEGLGVVSVVQGIGAAQSYHLSTATTDRTLDVTDTADRALMFEAFDQYDRATQRHLRSAMGADAPVLQMCDSAAITATCVEIPDSEGLTNASFSPDASLLSAWGSDPDLGRTVLRLMDSTTYEVVVEVVDDDLRSGIGAARWNPTSTAVAVNLAGSVATLEAAAGAVPEIVTPAGHGEPVSGRQAMMLLGWSRQDRILSIWSQLDYSTSPPTGSLFVQSVSADGQERRDLAPADVLGYGVVAPDGSAIVPERRTVTQDGQSATASVPVAFTDEPGAVPDPLALPWTGTSGGVLRAAQISILGFVALAS